MLQVILNLVRGKIIAVLLGATGMGVNSLFFSSVTMMNNFTGLGLNFSAVREIAKANEGGDHAKLSLTVKIFRRWLMATALLGLLSMVLLSPLLSSYTFKDGVAGISGENYFLAGFALLGFMVFFNTLSTGNASLLQGTRNLKKYALYSLTGTVSALIVSVPFYFFFGIKGIVPALIFSTLVTFAFSWLYTRNINSSPEKISFKQTYKGGVDMVKLGVTMMVSTTIGSVVHYLLNTFISSNGSVSDLGMYQAGMSITSQSVGLVFTAMAVDYYPRLSAVSHDNKKVREITNQQGVITMLIAAPVLALLAILSPLVVRVLLSKEFLPIVDFVRLLAFGMLFKAASYSIGAISFAKGHKKVFFLMEGVYMNASILIFSSIGYYFGGLKGLALMYLLMHIVYFIVVNIVTGKLYSFSINKTLRNIILISSTLMLLEYLVLRFIEGLYGYIAASFIVIALVGYSIIMLERLIGIRAMVISIFSPSSKHA